MAIAIRIVRSDYRAGIIRSGDPSGIPRVGIPLSGFLLPVQSHVRHIPGPRAAACRHRKAVARHCLYYGNSEALLLSCWSVTTLTHSKPRLYRQLRVYTYAPRERGSVDSFAPTCRPYIWSRVEWGLCVTCHDIGPTTLNL
jgi:hypothetical protein